MIYLSVPYFIENLSFYKAFKIYNIKFPTHQNIPFQIESIYGSFPYSLWAGAYNSNNGELIFYQEIEKFCDNNNLIPIRFDFTNFNIQKTDIYDCHMNAILNIFKANGSIIDFSQLFLFEYINNKYPNDFSFILSSPYNIENYQLLQNNNIKLFSCYYSEELNKIDTKHNIELIINNKCSKCYIGQQKKCYENEQLLSYNYSAKSSYNLCPNINFNYFNNQNLLKEIQYFTKLNFSHYKIDFPHIKDLNNFNYYLIHNLIKEEYQNECENFIRKILSNYEV